MGARFSSQVSPVKGVINNRPVAAASYAVSPTAGLPHFGKSGPVVTPTNVLALQRTLGNQAVNRLLARQKKAPQPVAAPTVQRADNKKHSNNFMRYLFSTLSSTGGYDEKNPAHKLAAGQAFIMDQNVYDSRIIIEASEGDFEALEDSIDGAQQSQLDQASLDLSMDIVPLLKTQPIEVISANFYKFIEGVTTGKKHSKVTWGSLTGWGAAKSMEAQLEKDGRQDGSTAGGAPGWMMQMEERMGGPKKTLYVRGHMLNNNLGGPGLDYNMVPFPGPNASGIKNVNGAHLHKYEKPVKQLYDKVKTGKVTNLIYKVNAIYPRAPRPMTDSFKNLYLNLNQLYDELVKEFRVSTKGRSDTDVDNEFANYPEIKPFLNTMGPSTPLDRRNYVETRPVQMEFDKTSFQTLLNDTNLKLNQRLVKRNIPEIALDASVPKNKDLSQVTFRQLVGFVKSNASLWALEDERVPASINCEVSWTDNSSIIPQPKSIPVDPIEVELPNRIDAPFADRDALETNEPEPIF